MKKQGLSDVTVNALSAMAENGRLPKLSAVLKSFQTLMSAHRGEVTCSVTTAKPLDAKSMDELKGALTGFLQKGQTLHLDATVSIAVWRLVIFLLMACFQLFLSFHGKVDPSILGGMVITIGDKYVDMSTASKIKMYTNVIKEAI